MIEQLNISNYALIENVSLTFRPGLSIVTGETGAGKSIMLGALSLLGGTRADIRGTLSNDKKTVVEALFSDISGDAREKLKEIDAEADDDKVLLRREITPGGRARAFVNDTPVTLGVLASISSHLLDIHTQNSNRDLASPESQLALLDSYCGNSEALGEYRGKLKTYLSLRREIKRIKEEAQKNRENRELIAFQLEQLDRLNPREGELRQVEREFDILSDADAIGESLRESRMRLMDSDMSALDQLTEAVGELSKIDMELLPGLRDANVLERLQNAIIDIKDIGESVAQSMEKVEANPVRLAKVTSRMNALYEANKRFHISEEDGLVKLRESLRRQLQAIDGEGETTGKLELRARELAHILKEEAAGITARRMDGARRFESEVMELARPLGLKNLDFKIDIQPCKLNGDGADRIEFICSFNKNGTMQPLSKVASGGEMSRMMLCIKAVMAGKSKLPTIVFDEVDTGVSGEIADKMGAMMLEMSKEIQVVSITHLPQVAARGERHYLVYKNDDNTRTISNVRELDREERVREIARMLSGAVVDEAAMANAESLLTAAGNVKE